jgi:DNA-directed RNA polymerase subunit beta
MPKLSKPVSSDRVVLTRENLRHLEPNLIESHLRSYELMISEGINEIFDEINPITDYTGESWELKFGEVSWGDADVTFTQAQKLGLSFDRPLYVDTKLINKKTGEIKKQKIFIAEIPIMSNRATFMVNGNERVVVMQIVRSEGVLFTESKAKGLRGESLNLVKLMPERGRWFDFEVNKNGVMSVKLLDKKPKIMLTTLLRALGYSSDNDVKKALAGAEKETDKYIENTLKRDPSSNTDEALLEIYRKLRPEDTLNLESAREFLHNLFFNKRRFYLGRIGRYQLNKKLGLNTPVVHDNYLLQKEDIVELVKAVIKVNNGTEKVDDMDSLANRRIRGVGELIGERIRMGVLRMEKNIKDRMSTHSTEDPVTPGMLVNTRPVIAAINQFFGSSSVSRYMDQENILSELETKRRITAGGPKGLTKERATFSVRDVHNSHYSRLCMVTTPEGPSIGIVSHMSIYARINDFGFLEAPYQRVAANLSSAEVTNKEFLGTTIRQDVTDAAGKVIAKEGTKLTAEVAKKLQAAGVTTPVKPVLTDVIDYVAADDEAAHKIGPAIIELGKENEVLAERVFVRYKGSFVNIGAEDLDYIDINPAQIGGIGFSLIPFASNDDPVRTLMGSNMQRQSVPLLKPEAPIVGTGYERVVARSSGRVVIAEDDGEVTYADAAKIQVKYKTAGTAEFYLEKFTRTNQNTCFSQTCRVALGDKFQKGDVLVDGPAMDNGELALGRNLVAAYMHYEGFNYEDGIIISERLVKEDALTSIHIHEYIQDVRETKLGDEQITRDIPNVGEYALRNLDETGIVRIGAYVHSQDILVGIIAPKGETELTAEEKLLRAIFGEYARDVRDNSLRLPHGDNGIVIGVQILDKDSGDKLNPGVLKQVKVWVARTSKISVGDKLTGLHGDKGVISAILPDEEMPFLADGTPVDIILGPSSMVKRMNLGQLQETRIARKAEMLGVKVEVPPFAPFAEDILDDMLDKAGKHYSEKVTLYDGRTGEAFPEPILVGRRHIIKLNHLSADKIHARSTGSYTMVTQQPLGGKAQMGGQRFGEMEVWALQAHAVPNVLHEMLTIKSDDVVGRAAAYKAMIQGQPIAPPSIPESFKVLISELRALSLNLDLIEPQEDEKDLTEIIEANLDETELEEINKRLSEGDTEGVASEAEATAIAEDTNFEVADAA